MLEVERIESNPLNLSVNTVVGSNFVYDYASP